MKLADLKTVHKELKERLVQEAEVARLEKEAAFLSERKKASEHDLFLRAIGKVTALPSKTTRPARGRNQPLKDDLSDEIDLTHLLTYDPDVSFRREGLGEDVIRKLRRSVWRIQGELDLHNLRSDEARANLAQYIRQAAAQGWRCIRIVHGKGLGSAGNAAVLKTKVLSWLVQLNEVRAFVQANTIDGGTGALVVLIGENS